MSFELGVPASTQQSSYQNATLQSDEGGRVAYSIAVYVTVPADVGEHGEGAVRDYLRAVLCAKHLAFLPNVAFHVVIGADDMD
jgi:hypothetical protein